MPQEAEKVFDTVIVGGGIAGLTAGYRLKDRDILVLEKDKECGGRTISRKMGEYYYNTGAQMIGGGTSRVARLADEIGVKRHLIDKTEIPIFMKGKLYHAASRPGFLWALPVPLTQKVKLALKALSIQRQFANMDRNNPNDPKVQKLSNTTFEDYIGHWHPDVAAMWSALCGSVGSYSWDVAAIGPIGLFLGIHFGGRDEFYVDGGTGNLTRTLARLIADKVQTSAEVQEVVHSDGKVRVTYMKDGQRKTVYAQRCVMATQGPYVLEVVKDLPAWKRDALSQLNWGSMSSAAWLLSEPSERFLGKGVWRVPVVSKAFISVTDPSFTFPREFKEKHGGLLRIQTAHEVSQKLQKMSDGEALEVLTDDLISCFPNIKGKIVSASVRHHPYANSPRLIGQQKLIPSIQAPTDNIYYAGDWTVSGGMEGGVASANRVLEEMRKAG